MLFLCQETAFVIHSIINGTDSGGRHVAAKSSSSSCPIRTSHSSNIRAGYCKRFAWASITYSRKIYILYSCFSGVTAICHRPNKNLCSGSLASKSQPIDSIGQPLATLLVRPPSCSLLRNPRIFGYSRYANTGNADARGAAGVRVQINCVV